METLMTLFLAAAALCLAYFAVKVIAILFSVVLKAIFESIAEWMEIITSIAKS